MAQKKNAPKQKTKKNDSVLLGSKVTRIGINGMGWVEFKDPQPADRLKLADQISKAGTHDEQVLVYAWFFGRIYNGSAKLNVCDENGKVVAVTEKNLHLISEFERTQMVQEWLSRNTGLTFDKAKN